MLKLLVSIILVLLYFLPTNNSEKYPICTNLHYFGTLKNSSQTNIFYYEFDVAVSPSNNKNVTYNNKLTLSNFTWNSTTSVQPILPILFYFNEKLIFFECLPAAFDKPCEVMYPNYIINPRFGLNNSNGDKIIISNDVDIFVNDGTFFNGDNGEFFTSEKSCMYSTTTIDDTNYVISEQACCNGFNQVSFTSDFNDICEIFESHLQIHDDSTYETLIVNAIYFIEESKIQFNFTLNSKFSYGYYYTIGFNSDNRTICKYYSEATNALISNICVLNGTGVAADKNDKQLELIFSFGNTNLMELAVYDGVIIGEIIIRDGRYYKNVNVPYMSSDWCWKRSADILTDDDASRDGSYNSTFCCTAFNGESAGTTSSSNDTTTSQSSETKTLLTTQKSSETTTTEKVYTTSYDVASTIYLSSSSMNEDTITSTTITPFPTSAPISTTPPTSKHPSEKTTTHKITTTLATTQTPKTTRTDTPLDDAKTTIYSPSPPVIQFTTIANTKTTSPSAAPATTPEKSSSPFYFSILSLNFISLQFLLQVAVIYFVNYP